MMPRMQWLNIFTVKWLALTISLVFLLQSCGPKRPSDSLVGVPESPSESSSLDSLLQGLRYIREHPTQREDERVQRFLWIDQWASILQSKESLNKELAQEFWADLTSFVQEPPMSRSSLQLIVARVETQLGKNVAYYQLYLNALKDSSAEEAMSYLQYVQDDEVSDLHLRALQLLELQNVKEIAESRRIGVLIPLSGQFASFGNQILGSIQALSELAYAEGIEFLIEDAGDNQDKLLESFQKLVLKERVSAIIGPVTSDASEFIFERAQILRVPVISLSPREGLEFFGNFNFRSSLSLEDQLTSVSQLIRDKMRSRRVGVLFPDSVYGWDVMERAKEAFDRYGIEIVEMQVYAKDATDFKEELKRMTRLDFPKLRANEVCAKDVPPEAQGNCVKSLNDLPLLYTFEVLFLPDSADKVGLILPTLPFLRMYGVQVVGLSGLNSTKLIERGQNSAEGVIFTDAFFDTGHNDRTRFFVETYSNLTKTAPGKLAAEAFDVGLLLVDQMRRIRGPVTREELVRRIANLRNFEGVTGNIFADGHQLRKQARIMLVRNGQFQEFQ